MRSLLSILATACLMWLCACGTTGAGDDPQIPCICGSDDAIFDGCASELCRDGVRNPDNPDCLCGPLEFEEE